MIAEHDVVVLMVDLPQHRLLKGDAGTVVTPPEREPFMVEFTDPFGRMVALEPLSLKQVRPLDKDEVLVHRAKAV